MSIQLRHQIRRTANNEPGRNTGGRCEDSDGQGNAGTLVLVVDPDNEWRDEEELHVVGEVPRPVHTRLRGVHGQEVVDEQQVDPPVACKRKRNKNKSTKRVIMRIQIEASSQKRSSLLLLLLFLVVVVVVVVGGREEVEGGGGGEGD